MAVLLRFSAIDFGLQARTIDSLLAIKCSLIRVRPSVQQELSQIQLKICRSKLEDFESVQQVIHLDHHVLILHPRLCSQYRLPYHTVSLSSFRTIPSNSRYHHYGRISKYQKRCELCKEDEC